MKPTEQIFTESLQTGFKEKLRHFFGTGIKLDLPFAIWRNPEENTIHAALQLSKEISSIEELENAPTGFQMSPFEENDENKAHFIKSDVLFDSDLNEILLAPGYVDSENKFEKFISEFSKIQDNTKFQYYKYLAPSPEIKPSKKSFIDLVERCKSSIGAGYYQKIVPSRQERFRIDKSFHPILELFKLCDTYPNAFISLVFIPNKGLWIGATPELLISIDENKIFKTISLAGTQEIREGFALANVAWTQKEIEEQALVSRYIVNCFKQIRLREFEEYGPKTVKAGNLIHLKTAFEVDIEAVNFPQLGTVMLDLLHPTSAVCGMPMIPASKFLKENEGYNREFYSGYLGPVNYDNNTALYVNLRCGRIYNNGIVLFAGAGVTEESDPEKEWTETEIKFETLLNVINNK